MAKKITDRVPEGIGYPTISKVYNNPLGTPITVVEGKTYNKLYTDRIPASTRGEPVNTSRSIGRAIAEGPAEPGAEDVSTQDPGALPEKEQGSQACANGAGGGPGETRGARNNSAYGSGVNSLLAAANKCGISRFEAAHPGMKAYAFSGKGSRPVPGSDHTDGNAIDNVIYGTDGVALKNLRIGDIPSARAYEALNENIGICYDQQNGAGAARRDLMYGGNIAKGVRNDAMHTGYRPGGSKGNNGRLFYGEKNPSQPKWSKADGSGIYDGPKDGASANSGDPAGEALGAEGDNSAYTDEGNSAAGGCPEDQGGCRPSSAAAPAAAAAMNAGKGLGSAQDMMANLSNMAQNPMAIAQTAVQTGLAKVLGSDTSGFLAAGANLIGGGNPLAAGAGNILASGAKQFLSAGGMTNPLTQITQSVAQVVQGIGGNILPSLTGVIPSLLQGGDVKGLLTGVIQNTVNSVIGKDLPQLGGFTNVFSSVVGAASGLTGIKNNLLGSAQQLFGNAASLSGLTTDKIPGFNISNDLLGAISDFEGVADGFNFVDGIWKSALDNTVDLTQPFNDSLNALISKPQINAFTTLYEDFNSLATQGLGNLTTFLPALGVDLANLNRLGDLTDLMNIGTPQQLTRQIIENGLGISTGLSFKLREAGIDSSNLYQDSNFETLYEILNSINDEQSIQAIMDTFLIDPRLNIRTTADLLNPKIIFPYSYDYNKFEDLRDISLTLAICGGTGRLKTFGSLGRVIATMETLKTFSDEDQSINIITPTELATMLDQMPVDGRYNNNGPTVADFIGTLAGYTHRDTLPKMEEILQKLYDDARTDDFYDLMETLGKLLNGDYYVAPVLPATVGTLTVPEFGSYTTLDNAVQAIVQAIENELESIKTEAENDPNFGKLINELETLHGLSADALNHEQSMRNKYGLEFGNPQRKNNFVGDDVTTSFSLQGSSNSNHLVYINGVNQLEGLDWDYNKTTNSIVFNTPPVVGTTVSLVYSVESTKPSSTPAEVYDFAMNLEFLALETGHGGPADFLNKIIQDDEYGMKIKAVMVQARNLERLSAYGIACPGFNRIAENSNNIKDFNFVNQTGIWSSDPSRAAEIWLQNTKNVPNSQSYIINKYNTYKANIQPDIDVLMKNIIRRLIFFTDGNIAISDKMIELYQNYSNNRIFNENVDDLDLGYDFNVPTEGYVLGPYKEIISSILDKENISNEIFISKLSINTENYLKSINLDIKLLVTMLQRILTANGAIYLGIDEGDFQAIFGIQSVSKALLTNIANNY